MPRIDQLPLFQDKVEEMSEMTVNGLNRGAYEKAFFLYQYSLELNWKFMVLLHNAEYGNSIQGGIKGNLSRIA